MTTSSDDPLGDAQSLADMLDLQDGKEDLWASADLEAVLQHQLDAPITVDLIGLDQALSRAGQTPETIKGPPIKTFRGLFEHPHPPIELLQVAKQFAKRCRNRPDGPLPDEIATVLYFLSIVVAMLRCGQQITGLDAGGMRHGLDWTLAQSWLDPSMRGILADGRQALEDKK